MRARRGSEGEGAAGTDGKVTADGVNPIFSSEKLPLTQLLNPCVQNNSSFPMLTNRLKANQGSLSKRTVTLRPLGALTYLRRHMTTWAATVQLKSLISLKGVLAKHQHNFAAYQ